MTELSAVTDHLSAVNLKKSEEEKAKLEQELDKTKDANAHYWKAVRTAEAAEKKLKKMAVKLFKIK